MRNDTNRLETFSDGVFAIAITLLVLNVIELPHTEGERLLSRLMHNWPVFAAYLAGFTTILVCWINHHFVFDYIDRNDNGLFVINGALLLVVSLVPFTTVMLAAHAMDEDRSAAVCLFGLAFCVVSVLAFGIWNRALRKDLIGPGHDPAELRAIRLMYICGMAYTFIILPLAYLNFHVGLVLYGLLFAGFFIPRTFVGWLMKWTATEPAK